MSKASDLEHAARCEAILAKLVWLANNNGPVALDADWGGNSLTIYRSDSHAHVGMPDTPWPEFVEQLHALLCGGREA